MNKMRKFLLLLIIVFPFFVKAQAFVYHPFPSNNGCWSYRYYDDLHLATNLLGHYSLNGDTSIASFNYKKISGAPAWGGNQNGAIRENNKIIYFRPDTSANEYILYNFNLNQGDTLFHPFGDGASSDTVIVTAVDSILTSSGYHRQIHFLNNWITWIEGIGSLNYLLNPFRILPFSGNDQLECMVGDSSGVLFGGSCPICMPVIVDEQKPINEIVITPNPFTSKTIITFSEAQKNTRIKLMNTLGECIQQLTTSNQQLSIDVSTCKAGVYFIEVETEKGFIRKKLVKE